MPVGKIVWRLGGLLALMRSSKAAHFEDIWFSLAGLGRGVEPTMLGKKLPVHASLPMCPATAMPPS